MAYKRRRRADAIFVIFMALFFVALLGVAFYATVWGYYSGQSDQSYRQAIR